MLYIQICTTKKERMACCPLLVICSPTRELKFVSPEQGTALCVHPTGPGVPDAPLLLPITFEPAQLTPGFLTPYTAQ